MQRVILHLMPFSAMASPITTERACQGLTKDLPTFMNLSITHVITKHIEGRASYFKKPTDISSQNVMYSCNRELLKGGGANL